MNTSFTPGPWVMTEEGEDDLVVCSERGDFICAPSGATFGEAIDNARLIASAPTLLDACLAALDDCIQDDVPNCDLAKCLRAAINLAT
jgi:hypothetical protein